MLNSNGFALNLHNFVLNPYGILLNLRGFADFVRNLKSFSTDRVLPVYPEEDHFLVL
jgi:hypothetical protein